MIRNCAIAVLAVAIAAAASAQQASTPALLTEAVAATQAAKADYAFDYDLTTSETNWRARYVPGVRPPLRLVSPDRNALEDDEARAFDRLAEDFKGVSWCASENMGRVAQMRLLREDDASATYAFQPTRESIQGEQARRFAQHLRGEVTLTRQAPDITRIRLYVPEAFSPFPLVQLQSLNIVITCQLAPNGRRYAADTTTDIRGRAFGQDFSERSVQRARNLQ